MIGNGTADYATAYNDVIEVLHFSLFLHRIETVLYGNSSEAIPFNVP